MYERYPRTPNPWIEKFLDRVYDDIQKKLKADKSMKIRKHGKRTSWRSRNK